MLKENEKPGVLHFDVLSKENSKSEVLQLDVLLKEISNPGVLRFLKYKLSQELSSAVQRCPELAKCIKRYPDQARDPRTLSLNLKVTKLINLKDL